MSSRRSGRAMASPPVRMRRGVPMAFTWSIRSQPSWVVSSRGWRWGWATARQWRQARGQAFVSSQKTRTGESLSGKAYLLVAEVGGGVGGPYIAMDRLRPDPEVAPAELLVAAEATAPGQVFPPLPQGLEEGLGRVFPYLGEGPLPDIAQGIVPPELVGVDPSPLIYGPHAPPPAVSPPPPKPPVR